MIQELDQLQDQLLDLLADMEGQPALMDLVELLEVPLVLEQVESHLLQDIKLEELLVLELPVFQEHLEFQDLEPTHQEQEQPINQAQAQEQVLVLPINQVQEQAQLTNQALELELEVHINQEQVQEVLLINQEPDSHLELDLTNRDQASPQVLVEQALVVQLEQPEQDTLQL